MEDISRLLDEYLRTNPEGVGHIAEIFGVTKATIRLWASDAQKLPAIFKNEIVRYIQANSQSDRL